MIGFYTAAIIAGVWAGTAAVNQKNNSWLMYSIISVGCLAIGGYLEVMA